MDDVVVHIPAEHFEALSSVIRAGLLRSKIDKGTKAELETWWDAEEGLIRDDLSSIDLGS